jgi:pimeloyl-ACP methyl ester carboxylesterase
MDTVLEHFGKIWTTWGSVAKDVMNVLAIVRSEFNIDENRMYLAGHSMGGAGTLHLGGKYPHLWAAIGLMCPGLHGDLDKLAKDVSQLPLVVVQGGNDTICKPEPCRELVQKRKALAKDCEYIEVQDGDHVFVASNPDYISKIFAFFDEYHGAVSPEQPRPESPEVEGPEVSEPPRMWRLYLAMALPTLGLWFKLAFPALSS